MSGGPLMQSSASTLSCFGRCGADARRRGQARDQLPQRDRTSARGRPQLVSAGGQARSSPVTAIAVKFPAHALEAQVGDRPVADERRAAELKPAADPAVAAGEVAQRASGLADLVVPGQRGRCRPAAPARLPAGATGSDRAGATPGAATASPVAARGRPRARPSRWRSPPSTPAIPGSGSPRSRRSLRADRRRSPRRIRARAMAAQAEHGRDERARCASAAAAARTRRATRRPPGEARRRTRPGPRTPARAGCRRR